MFNVGVAIGNNILGDTGDMGLLDSTKYKKVFSYIIKYANILEGETYKR